LTLAGVTVLDFSYRVTVTIRSEGRHLHYCSLATDRTAPP
jgi:hypothetical protein